MLSMICESSKFSGLCLYCLYSIKCRFTIDKKNKVKYNKINTPLTLKCIEPLSKFINVKSLFYLTRNPESTIKCFLFETIFSISFEILILCESFLTFSYHHSIHKRNFFSCQLII